MFIKVFLMLLILNILLYTSWYWYIKRARISKGYRKGYEDAKHKKGRNK